MANYNNATALSLLKSRLDRLQEDTSRDDVLGARLDESAEELEAIGIALQDTQRDLMLIVDYAAWKYQNRDKPGEMPQWLKRERFERWLESGVAG